MFSMRLLQGSTKQAQRCFFRGLASKVLSNVNNKALPNVTLYKYKICPYCNEVKSLLDYMGLPYKQVEVDPLSKAELKFSTTYRKVPIMMMDNKQVNDSKVIMDTLIQRLTDDGLISAESLKQLTSGSRGNKVVEEWVDWASKKLAVLMYPNLCASVSSAWKAFDYVHQVEGWGAAKRTLIQVVGTLAMRAGSSRLKKKYAIEDERQALLSTLASWSKQLGGDVFHGGSSPDLADVCVFGVIDAVKGMPLHVDVLNNTAIGPWYQAMQKHLDQAKA